MRVGRSYAFTRAGDRAGQQFALRSGAAWAGESGQRPPVPLDAAIIFAPAGELVPAALKAVAQRGLGDLRRYPYERYSGLSPTRFSGENGWCARSPISPGAMERSFWGWRAESPSELESGPFALTAANQALSALRSGNVQGAAVLVVD